MSNIATLPTTAQTAHGIIMTILWGAVVDILVIVIRYFKHWQPYLKIHVLFGLLNIISIAIILLMLISNSSYLFYNNQFITLDVSKQIHFIFGMVFMCSIFAVQLIGAGMKHGTEDATDKPGDIKKKKNWHVIFGYTFYLLSKGQLVLGWYIWNSTSYYFVMTILIVYYFVVAMVVIFYFQRKYRNNDEALFVPLSEPPVNPQYSELLNKINEGVNTNSLKKQFPDMKFVFFKDKVLDVTKLNHPGGNLVINLVVGEQISRYIVGAYGLQIFKQYAYKHSFYAQRLLGQFEIGSIQPNKGDLLIKSGADNTWILSKQILLSKGVNAFYFQSSNIKIRPQPNITYLGKHFLMSSLEKQPAPRLYTLALCMSPLHRSHISKILEFLNKSVTYQLQFPDQIAELPFVIKEYKVNGLSQYLHRTKEGDKLTIEGPFGRGLELEEGVNYIFCGGTGVLPFLDLVYEILLEIEGRVQKKVKGRLPKNLQANMYLSVNTIQQLNSLDLIINTYLVDLKYKINIFKLFIRISKGNELNSKQVSNSAQISQESSFRQLQSTGKYSSAEFDSIPVFNERINIELLTKVVIPQLTKTAYICGSPDMNYEIANALKTILPDDKIRVL